MNAREVVAGAHHHYCPAYHPAGTEVDYGRNLTGYAHGEQHGGQRDGSVGISHVVEGPENGYSVFGELAVEAFGLQVEIHWIQSFLPAETTYILEVSKYFPAVSARSCGVMADATSCCL